LLLLLWDNTVSEQTAVLLKEKGGIIHGKLQLTTATSLSLASPRLWAGSISHRGWTVMFLHLRQLSQVQHF